MKNFEKMRILQIKTILSTDLLSRGIDLPDVKMVVNFDLPLSLAEYMHRIGRTGRFGSQGVAISFITDKDLNLPYVKDMLLQHQYLQLSDLSTHSFFTSPTDITHRLHKELMLID